MLFEINEQKKQTQIKIAEKSKIYSYFVTIQRTPAK